MEASAAGAADPYLPIDISSDEEDGQAYFTESYSAEEVQIHAGATDPYFPIDISSDEEDGQAYFTESYSAEGVQIHAGAADLYFPIDISSDEEDGQAYFTEPYSAEEVQIQEAILLSLDTSRARTATACSASSSSHPAGASSTPKETPLDRKGKRKLRLEDDPIDSETKRSKRNRFNFNCAICFETVPAAEKFVMSHCAHAFCNSCVGRYVAGKVADNVAVIGCPDPACEKGVIEMDMCRDIIPPGLIDRWNVVLCEELLGDDKFYCPFKDCSALLLNDGSVKIRKTECPHCHRLFCARCRVPWHNGITCKAFKKLRDDEKEENYFILKKLADKEKWQRCPKCRMYVSRKSGCSLIKCRCKQYFCYRCAAPVDRKTHYCGCKY